MAEGLLRHHLAEAGIGVRVRSAGTLGWNERPATDHAVRAMAERGVDITAHRSRTLTDEDVASADLVIGMTRIHAGAVVARNEALRERTFLPGELVRLAEAVGPCPAPEKLAAWAAELGAQRPAGPIGRAMDEIPDPAGEPLDVYRAVADRLDRIARSLLRLL